MTTSNGLGAQTGLTLFQEVLGNNSMSTHGRRTMRALGISAIEDIDTLRERSRQVATQTGEKVGARARQSQRTMGKMVATVSDSNIAGPLVARLRNQIGVEENRDRAAIVRSGSGAMDQIKRAAKSKANELSSRMNQITRPSAVGSGLRVFGTAMNDEGPSLMQLFKPMTGGTPYAASTGELY